MGRALGQEAEGVGLPVEGLGGAVRRRKGSDRLLDHPSPITELSAPTRLGRYAAEATSP
jgi:hypothetical protein